MEITLEDVKVSGPIGARRVAGTISNSLDIKYQTALQQQTFVTIVGFDNARFTLVSVRYHAVAGVSASIEVEAQER